MKKSILLLSFILGKFLYYVVGYYYYYKLKFTFSLILLPSYYEKLGLQLAPSKRKNTYFCCSQAEKV